MVSQVAELQRQWKSDASLTQATDKVLDQIGFSEQYIKSVTLTGAKRKWIKDSVWGMLEFSPREVLLINSPLMQRLRKIHQLGFSYLTYPTAEHSRFVHSLGMAHVVKNFISSIERDKSEIKFSKHEGLPRYENMAVLEPLTDRELVYAAILHDVGHLPFSHATESALVARMDDFTWGGNSLYERLGLARLLLEKDVSLSEAISIMIVLSQRFSDFYSKIEPEAGSDPRSLQRIACLIAGISTVDTCPNIQEIISAAAVDADKIDYVARDAKACGIAVGVDVSRIFLGGGIVNARMSAYDPSYTGSETAVVCVVNASGADTLDEIVQARSGLYQRVYLHPVTRTAEALLARALKVAATTRKAVDPSTRDVLTLWSLDDFELLRRLALAEDAEVQKLSRALQYRILPKKACALAASLTQMQVRLDKQFNNTVPDNIGSVKKDVCNSYIELLTRKRIGEIDLPALEEDIRQEAQCLADALISGGRGDLVPVEALETVALTPIAAVDSSRPDAVVFQNGEFLRTYDITNVQGQQDAYDIFKAVGYVVCDEEWRHLVLQAARVTIYRESRSQTPSLVRHVVRMGTSNESVQFQRQTILDLDRVLRRSSSDTSKAREVCDAAAAAGYFNKAPILSTRFRSDHHLVRRVLGKFEVFDGEQGWRVRAETIAAFIDQFPVHLREPALETIADGELLDQGEMKRLVVDAVIQAHKVRPGQMVVAPLSSSSGGAVQAMVQAGLPSYVRSAASLTEALKGSAEEMVILIDDNSASGVQASAQLYEFCGEDRPAELANENDLFSVLTTNELVELRKRDLAIIVAVGLPGAQERLRKTAAALSLENFKGLFFGQNISAGLAWDPAVEAYLRDVGRDLMAHRRFGTSYEAVKMQEDRDWCLQRSFGYGEAGGILATHINVPSSTVTAVWQPGIFEGRAWVPLLLRRGRFNELILC
jgi:HD superfamily phosphohydrolase